MTHQVPNLHDALSLGGELRPVMHDRSVPIEFCTICEYQRDQGNDRLGRGIHVGNRVLFPWASLRRVGPTTPQIDYRFALNSDGEARTEIRAVGEVGRKQITDTRESLLCETLYRSGTHQEFPSLITATTAASVLVNPPNLDV